MADRDPGQYATRGTGVPLVNSDTEMAIAMSELEIRQEDPTSSRARDSARDSGAEDCPSTGFNSFHIPKTGYPAFADFVAADTDNTGFVFRSFRVLVARNLLYMQSELINLSLKLEKHDVDAPGSDPGTRRAMRSWSLFMKDDEKGKLAVELNVKLRAYRQSG